MELSRTSDKWYAVMATLLFHALLLLLFFLYTVVTPLPPFVEEAGGGGGLGVELNFGDSEEGMGNINPDLLSANSPNNASPSSSDAVMLDDNTDDNYIEELNKKTPKDQKRPELKRPQDGPTITQKSNTPENAPDKRALYSGNKGGSEGKTGKNGNQGSKTGTDPFSPVYSGKGGGDGKGDGNGKGGGSGDGNGTGKGSGTGPGISVSLLNRSPLSLPKPSYNSEKSGKVVVDITVDEKGNVIKAVAGGRGTTVQDKNLFDQAVSAARKAKFNPSSTGENKQVGTITYNFIRR
jgi:TonB family protein